MGPVTKPDCAPYCVHGPLAAGRHITVESPTSQYLSALLLTAPLIPAAVQAPLPPWPADSAAPTPVSGSPTPVAGSAAHTPAAGRAAPDTTITVALLNEHPYVDMTCWWLDRQQITYSRDGYNQFRIPAGQRYRPHTTTLPGDYSSATFWFCAAAITGHPVTVSGLAPDDVQGDRGVLDILTTLGCRVDWTTDDSRDTPLHTVTVSGTPQRGGTFDLNAMPDALPALAVLACFAPAPITLANVPQAREKETDRIAVMATELEKLGATVRELPDGIEIEPKVLRSGTVDSHGDHRIAMALAIGALAAAGPVTITDAGAAAVTYPAFYDDLARLAPGAL